MHDTKRFIGRKFNDASVQEDMKHVAFKVEEDESGEPVFRVLTPVGEKLLSPLFVGYVLPRAEAIPSKCEWRALCSLVLLTLCVPSRLSALLAARLCSSISKVLFLKHHVVRANCSDEYC